MDEFIGVLTLLFEHDLALQVFRFVGALLVVAGFVVVIGTEMSFVPVPIALILGGILLVVMPVIVPILSQVFA